MIKLLRLQVKPIPKINSEKRLRKRDVRGDKVKLLEMLSFVSFKCFLIKALMIANVPPNKKGTRQNPCKISSFV